MRFCLAHVFSIIYHFYDNWQQSLLWDAEKEKGLSFYADEFLCVHCARKFLKHPVIKMFRRSTPPK